MTKIVAFDNHAWKVSKGSIVVARGKMVDTLCLLTSISNYTMDLASIGEDATLWYHKLGHMSEKGLQILH